MYPGTIFRPTPSRKNRPITSLPSVRPRALGVDKTGYRLLANHGRDSHQEVQHLHVHILAGQPLGPMLEDGDLPPDTEYMRAR